MDTFVKKTLKVSTIKKCINLVKDRWADTLRHLQHRQETYPSILAIENAKAPDLRTGIVLKSGAKVERILRYAFSAECAKLNSAETRKGQNHRLVPLYQYLTEI